MRGWLRSVTPLVVCFALLLVSPVPAAAQGPATIDLSPTSGPPGTSITVSGTNWTHPSWASGVPINIYQNYGNGNLKRLAEGHSGRPDSDGRFRVEMTIPSSAEAGLVTVSTLAGGGYDPSAGFTVTGSTPTATLTVDRAFTTNGTTTEQSAFKPGDTIWYVVSMNVKNGPARATVQWRATGPREIYNYTSNPADINSGYQAPYGPATIPQDAPSGTYTLTAQVTFNGSTTTRTSTFRVSTHWEGTGGGLVKRCLQTSDENQKACINLLDALFAIFTRMHVDVEMLTPLFNGCRAGDAASCRELQAKADSLGIG